MPDETSAPARIEVSDETVAALLRAQYPRYADEPVQRLVTSGTVNALYRVADAVVRMPLLIAVWSDAAREASTLRLVADAVRVGTPPVIHLGEPGEGYPAHWLILGWLSGTTPAHGAGGAALADDLAGFFADLASVDPTAAPPSARPPLREHDDAVLQGLEACADLVDVAALRARWQEALDASPWRGPRTWVHGDLLWGNLLLGEDERLSAVLDWESAGAGDPAVDLMAAWSVLNAAGRARLRDRLPLDADTWTRGRGWSLAQAAVGLAYFRGRNTAVAAHSLAVLRAIAHD